MSVFSLHPEYQAHDPDRTVPWTAVVHGTEADEIRSWYEMAHYVLPPGACVYGLCLSEKAERAPSPPDLSSIEKDSEAYMLPHARSGMLILSTQYIPSLGVFDTAEAFFARAPAFGILTGQKLHTKHASVNGDGLIRQSRIKRYQKDVAPMEIFGRITDFEPVKGMNCVAASSLPVDALVLSASLACLAAGGLLGCTSRKDVQDTLQSALLVLSGRQGYLSDLKFIAR